MTDDTDDMFDRESGDSHFKSDTSAGSTDLPILVADHLVEIERGTADNSIAARDTRIAALLRAIDEAGQTAAVTERLADATEGPTDVSVSQSGIISAAVRVGLQEACPDLYDDAKAGLEEYQQRQAESF